MSTLYLISSNVMERGTKGRTIPFLPGLEFTVAWLEIASSLLSSAVSGRHITYPRLLLDGNSLCSIIFRQLNTKANSTCVGGNSSSRGCFYNITGQISLFYLQRFLRYCWLIAVKCCRGKNV
uniref:Uncharacterized protein n=1 Tax=Oryza punctata TaxID=4537 RepID=A0A0E0M000_ORYPU